jgi:uncharacterized protein GlcG (DUF336 family)
MNIKKIALVSLFFLISNNSFGEEEILTQKVSRLTLNTAIKIAKASIVACEAKGIPISVSVVDRNGIAQVQLRDTMAPPVSYPISFKKAYTSVMFNAKGSQLTSQASSPLQNLNLNLMFSAGSVPIKAGGVLYGAIGVSGAPSGKVDEECATKGLEAVLEDLEMM